MSQDRPLSAATLVRDVRNGNRRALSLALSLVESTASADRRRAAEVVELASASIDRPTRRMCLTGAPGVGKSTLMEQVGLELIHRRHRVAVLAVDPSSRRTGGSILGDKMRMPRLAVHDDAFVRPSPARDALGGTAEATRDAITLCEAAGFDTIIVETVGVGQSEIEASLLVDAFWLLVLPTAGDDLQGIKRGIMEVADGVLVTKRDLDTGASDRACHLYRSALQLLQPSTPDWNTPVLAVSAVAEGGLREFLDVLDAFFAPERAAAIDARRALQRRSAFTTLLQRRISEQVLSAVHMADRVRHVQQRVDEEGLPPTTAVLQLLDHMHITVTDVSPQNPSP